MDKTVKILIAYHKPSALLKSDIYTPIFVGADANNKCKDGILSKKDQEWMNKNLIRDDNGKNISKLNRYFNEMSAIYWAWKNQDELNNPEYIGLMHYRRHFIFNEKNYSKKCWLLNSPVYCYSWMNKKYLSLLEERYVKKLINKYDIICSKLYNANNLLDGKYYRNSKERFCEIARVSPLWYEKMENIIIKNYPEYLSEIHYLSKNPNHYLCNMFVMKKELFDKYCEFSFDVLFKIYNEFKDEKLDIWQTRAIGFLAEFLTSMFISKYKLQNKDKVKELDLTYIEKPYTHTFKNKMNVILRTNTKKILRKFYKIINLIQFKNHTQDTLNTNAILSKLEENKKNFEDEKKEILNEIKVKILASKIHSKSFKDYKDKFKGQNVILCATGPTLNKFKPDIKGIYIGVNKAFLNKKIKFDYLFIQDFNKNDNILELIKKYKAKKFYGLISDLRLEQIRPIEQIPLSYFCGNDVNQYILESNLNYNIAKNIEIEPMGDLAGTVFSAIQFILYTHPNKIYLAGCDCSSGYFYKENEHNDLSYQIESWKKIKEFVLKNYPDIEIISINPIGLKGMFENIFV